MVTIQLRKTERGDSGSITGLLSGVNHWPGFDHRGTMDDFWEWRYVRNPLGFTNEIVAAGDGRVLSHAASLPVEVRIGQRVRLCAQLSDLYTDPASRGQGLMESVTSTLFARDRENGIEVELAFPSPAGYELTMKAGFVELPVRMGHYELITNPGQFFKNVRFGALKKVAYESMRVVKGRGNGASERVEVSEVTAFPDDLFAMTDEFERGFDLVFRRDEKYLRWRYEHPESGTFTILVSTVGGRTTGYAVLRPYEVLGRSYMDIVDLVALPGDNGSLRGLVGSCVEVCRRNDTDMMQLWLPTNHPFLPELGRAGFLLRQPIPGERRMRLVCRQFSSDPELRRLLAGDLRYHLVLGDSDWV